jgi:hypothetical protein
MQQATRRALVFISAPFFGGTGEIGAPFIKSVELRSRPAAHFYVLLYAKSTIPNARHDSRAIF